MLMKSDLKNILIIKPSALGDIVLALPVLSALRKSFPNAEITWLVRPEFAPLLKNHPYLDDIILFDRKLLASAWRSPRAFTELFSLIKRLRHSNFDAVIDLQGLFRTAALSWLSGCKKRYGMAKAREFASIFYTDKVEQTPDCVHLVDYYLKIAQSAGVSDISVSFVFPHDNAAEDSARKLLQNQNASPDNYVVIVPSSAWSDKCWPAERFAALSQKISLELRIPIVAVGTASDNDLVERIKKFAAVPIVNLAGSTKLPELVALLKNAKLVVSNDTGPGHIAAALGVPLVMIFGWSNPLRISPYKRDECIAAAGLYNRGDAIKSKDPKHGAAAVTFDEVYRKVLAQIKR